MTNLSSVANYFYEQLASQPKLFLLFHKSSRNTGGISLYSWCMCFHLLGSEFDSG